MKKGSSPGGIEVSALQRLQYEGQLNVAAAIAPVLLVAVLVVISFENFLLFHALAELFSVLVGVSLYLIARAGYVFNRNNYLLFISKGFFAAAVLDLLHTLSYSGMGLLGHNDPNPATQLWLCARFIQAVTLLLAQRFVDNTVSLIGTLPIFMGYVVLCTFLVFGGYFPDAYLANHGLTPFKVWSEYSIIAILLFAGFYLFLNRQVMDAELFRGLAIIIALTAISEFMFTLYISVYGLENVIGHVAKFLAYWVLLNVVVRRMLQRPFELLSRDAESFDSVPIPMLLVGPSGLIQSCNEAARERQPEGGVGRRLHEVWHSPHVREGECPVCNALAKGKDIECDIQDSAAPTWSEVKLHGVGGGKRPVGFICVHADITEKRRAAERIRQAATVFASTAEAVVITDTDYRIAMVNRAFTELTGFGEAEVVGKPPLMLRSAQYSRLFYLRLLARLRRDGVWSGEIWYRRKVGGQSPALLNLNAVRDEKGGITHYVAVFSDISAIKATEAKLEYQAHHDVLTGLPNRLYLSEFLCEKCQSLKAKKAKLAFVILDLDRFKDVNDSFGHETGDNLIRTVGTWLNANLEDCALIARLGSDEFGLVFENVESVSDALTCAQQAVDLISIPWRLSNGFEMRVSASAGVSLAPDFSQSPAQLLQQADTALYQARSANGSGCAVYSKTLLDQTLRRVELEARLRAAMAAKEFEVFYQPQVSVTSGQLIGAEALIRWRDSVTGAYVSPEEFIPVAEYSGLIGDLGDWVLRETCRQGAEWIAQGLPHIGLAVNLSPAQLRHGDIVAQVKAVLMETGFPAARLELELTEGALMEDRASVIAILSELRALGVRIAIDDFGTGYSSLAYLRRFPLDLLKIDKRFIDEILTNDDDETITRSIIVMGQALGLKVLAEGVETPGQLEKLRQMNCDFYQGYLASKPVSGREFGVLFREMCAAS